MQKTKLPKTIIFISCFLFLFCLTGQARAATECNDGLDNDGDGKIDLADAQCANTSDDHESDNPRQYFFKTHTTFNQKIPTDTTVSPRNTGTKANFLNYKPRVTVSNWSGGALSLGGQNNLFQDDGTFTPTQVYKRGDSPHIAAPYEYITDAHNEGWDMVPLKKTGTDTVPVSGDTLAGNSARTCVGTSPWWSDNQMNIISQDGTKVWTLYSFSWCDGEPPKAKIIRLSYNIENGVDSQITAGYTPRGDMKCGNWGTNYTTCSCESTAGVNSAKFDRLLGLMTYDEISTGDTFDHALVFAWLWRDGPGTLSTPYPSCQGISDYTNPDPAMISNQYYPMAGERFQITLTHSEIDAYAVAQGWSDAKKKMLYAMADYGFIMTENGGTQTEMGLWSLIEPDKHSAADWNTLLGGPSENRYIKGLNNTDFWEHVRLVPSPTPPFAGQPQCADGIDNENPKDGKIDYPADPGCSSAYGDNSESGTSPQYAPADVNQDTKINIQDIQIVVKVITGTLTNSRADVNGDGVKNIKDIQAIVRAIVNPN